MTGRVTVHRSPELLFGNGSALPPSLSRATMYCHSPGHDVGSPYNMQLIAYGRRKRGPYDNCFTNRSASSKE